jgi:hypothetical protein
MRYARRSQYVSLSQVINHVAVVETEGDREAARQEVVAAAADDGIIAYGISGSIPISDEIGRWAWQCVRRGEGYIHADSEIMIKCEDKDTLLRRKETLAIRIYEIEFARADVLQLWPPKRKPEIPPSTEIPSAPPSATAGAKTGPKPRAAYRNELRTFLAPRDIAMLVRQGKDAVAAEFIAHCRQHKPSLAAVLPKPREVAKQVQKILDSRRAKPQQSSTRERPQTPSSSPNRG